MSGHGKVNDMSDRELIDALTILARRLGLLGAGQRLTVEDVETSRPECHRAGSPAGKPQVTLLCSYDLGHEGPCSWAGAFVGILRDEPCGAVWPQTVIHRGGPAGAPPHPSCVGLKGHEGPHAAPYLGPDPLGTEYTWTDAGDSMARPHATVIRPAHRCPRCGSSSWVAVSLHGPDGQRNAQCVPCGKVHVRIDQNDRAIVATGENSENGGGADASPQSPHA